MIKKRLRGSCSRCGRIGAERRDGHIQSHPCIGQIWQSPVAVDVQTFEWRVRTFVEAMLPLATDEERAKHIEAVTLQFSTAHEQPASVGAVDPVAGGVTE